MKKQILIAIMCKSIAFGAQATEHAEVSNLNTVRVAANETVERVAASPHILGCMLNCDEREEFIARHSTPHDLELRVFNAFKNEYSKAIDEVVKSVSNILGETGCTWEIDRKISRLKKEKDLAIVEMTKAEQDHVKAEEARVNQIIAEESKPHHDSIRKQEKIRTDWISRHTKVWGENSGRQFFDHIDEEDKARKCAPHYEAINRIYTHHKNDQVLVDAKSALENAKQDVSRKWESDNGQALLVLEMEKELIEHSQILSDFKRLPSMGLVGSNFNLSNMSGPQHRKALWDFCVEKENKQLLGVLPGAEG